MNRKLLLASVVATAVCAVPATAGAATLTTEGNTLVYTAGSGGSSMLISTQEDWETKVMYLTFSDSSAPQGQPAAGCEITSGYNPGFRCALSGVQALKVAGSEANDRLSIFSDDVPDSLPIELHGNGGDDELIDAYDGAANRTFSGGAGNDKLTGYFGNDTLDGGPGNDTVDGGGGADTVRGGDGDDTLWGDHYKDPAGDVLDGGAGTDVIDGEWTQVTGNANPPATVTMDGQANDGRPGEGDNVMNVETIKGYIGLTFTGSDAAETVDMLNPPAEQSNTLRGMGGNDRLVGKDAADTIDGGAGDDHVEGGYNHDTVTGGPGKDMIYGDKTGSQSCWYSCNVPFGNDTIHARDGEVDQVDCGVGEDTAIVDAIDVVANCEKVDAAGGAKPGPGPGGTPNPGGGPQPGGAGPGGIALAGAAKLSQLTKGRLSATVACAAACKVSAKLVIAGKTAASGKTTLLAAGTAKAKLKPARAMVNRLKKLKKATATLKVTVQSASGTASFSKKVSLKK